MTKEEEFQKKIREFKETSVNKWAAEMRERLRRSWKTNHDADSSTATATADQEKKNSK